MKRRWFEFGLHHPRIVAVLTGLLLLGSMTVLFDTAVDNSLEVWLMKDSKVYQEYKSFVHAFGSEEFILVALHGKGLLEEEGFELLRQAADRAAAVPGITSVLSPVSIEDELALSSGAARKLLLAVPTYQGLLVSKDGETAGLYLSVNPSAASRPAMVRALRESLKFVEAKGFSLHLGGPPVLNAELNALSSKDPRLLFPVVFLVTALLLAVLFRSLAGLLVPMITLFVTVLVSLAAVNLLGLRLNMITVGFPAVLWVLVISQSIHLLMAFGRERNGNRTDFDAIRSALGQIFYPCFLMTVTTGAGFLSLLLSRVGPVRELGAYTAGGIALGFLANLFVGPAFLLIRGGRKPVLRVRMPQGKGGFACWVAWTARYRIPVLAVAAILVVVSLFFASGMEVETNALRFLRPDNPLLGDYAFIQENLTGLSSLEIDVKREEGEALSTLIGRIAAFSRKAATAFPECRILSIDDFLNAAAFSVFAKVKDLDAMELSSVKEEARTFFETSTPVSRAAFLPVLRSHSDVSPYISAEGDRLRISVFSSVFEGSRFKRFKDGIGRIAQEVLGKRARLTGIVPLLVSMQESLFISQVKCLGAAMALVFVFMVLAGRSIRLGLVSMIPNIFPIVLNFGVMGLLRVRLDVATMMIASVAMGIAVDNTIHLVVAYRELRREQSGGCLALAVERKGRAILSTTLVNGLGFLVLAFSVFLPMGWFGGLTGLTIFWAAVGDLVLLPALLSFNEEEAPCPTQGN